jgi:hypothetical protein
MSLKVFEVHASPSRIMTVDPSRSQQGPGAQSPSPASRRRSPNTTATKPWSIATRGVIANRARDPDARDPLSWIVSLVQVPSRSVEYTMPASVSVTACSEPSLSMATSSNRCSEMDDGSPHAGKPGSVLAADGPETMAWADTQPRAGVPFRSRSRYQR